MGKGSSRREKQITDKEMEERWRATFSPLPLQLNTVKLRVTKGGTYLPNGDVVKKKEE